MLHPLSLLFPSSVVKGVSLRAASMLGSASKKDATGKVQCPACASSSVKRSIRRGLWERLKSVIAIYPYRCSECNCRFFARGQQRQ